MSKWMTAAGQPYQGTGQGLWGFVYLIAVWIRNPKPDWFAYIGSRHFSASGSWRGYDGGGTMLREVYEAHGKDIEKYVLSAHRTEYECLHVEKALHEHFDVNNNPKFLNLRTGDSRIGGELSELARIRMRLAAKNAAAKHYVPVLVVSVHGNLVFPSNDAGAAAFGVDQSTFSNWKSMHRHGYRDYGILRVRNLRDYEIKQWEQGCLPLVDGGIAV